MSSPIQLNGRRFGKLVVQGQAEGRQHGQLIWRCLCDCGTETTVLGANLRKGNTASCGCTNREKSASRLRTHGESASPEFDVWCGIKKRCNNPSDKRYDRYGGRGIGVCERWESSFENFVADMGPRPTSRHTIERVNNDGHYAPDNCRWATRIEQANNRSTTRFVEFRGRTISIPDLAREVGVDARMIRRRLDAGWELADAINLPKTYQHTSRHGAKIELARRTAR